MTTRAANLHTQTTATMRLLGLLLLTACVFTETWAKYFEGDSQGNRPCVKVFMQEHHSFDISGTETIETYVLQNDTLKKVGIKKRKY